MKIVGECANASAVNRRSLRWFGVLPRELKNLILCVGASERFGKICEHFSDRIVSCKTSTFAFTTHKPTALLLPLRATCRGMRTLADFWLNTNGGCSVANGSVMLLLRNVSLVVAFACSLNFCSFSRPRFASPRSTSAKKSTFRSIGARSSACFRLSAPNASRFASICAPTWPPPPKDSASSSISHVFNLFISTLADFRVPKD